MSKFSLGADFLSIKILIELANGKRKITIQDEVKKKILKSKSYIDDVLKSDKIVYGINTGFGSLCDKLIPVDQAKKLQENLLKSHSVGVGKIIPTYIAKMMLIAKAHALSKGFSGIRYETIKRILWHIKNDVIPIVPEHGSVGASGDLAPLSHLFLPLIGLGEVEFQGKKHKSKEILNNYNLKPLSLHPKEGLALTNGTQFIASFATYGLYRMHYLLEQEDIISAMLLDAFKGSIAPFDKRLHDDIRPFLGNKLVSKRIRKILSESEIMKSHINCDNVQDPYSIRCISQVHGASRNAWLHAKQLIEIELNSVTDNPVVLNKNDIISGGGFHAQPISMVVDYASLAASEIGNIADRRCYLILEGKRDLPQLLMKSSGIDSGFMIPQYTTAALVSHNKSLCFPASADSIPTSMGQEDHVSMGSISVLKFNQIIDNLEYIQAIELLYAAQAIDFRRPLKSSEIIENIYQETRKLVPFKSSDTVLYEDINILHKYIISFKIAKVAETLNKDYSEFCL